MTIIPDLAAKLLGEMSPGELIRFRFGEKMLLGMVARCDFLEISSGMVIVVMDDLPDRPGTAGGFLPMDEFFLAETGLSYGTKHIVVVHPAAPVVWETDERFYTNGALLVGGGRVIRSRVLNNRYRDFALTIDIDKWHAVPTSPQNPLPRRVAVLAWELRLLTDMRIDPPLRPVFTFAA